MDVGWKRSSFGSDSVESKFLDSGVSVLAVLVKVFTSLWNLLVIDFTSSMD